MGDTVIMPSEFSKQFHQTVFVDNVNGKKVKNVDIGVRRDSWYFRYYRSENNEQRTVLNKVTIKQYIVAILSTVTIRDVRQVQSTAEAYSKSINEQLQRV